MVPTNLEVGYGMAKGKDAEAVGRKATRQALKAIKEHPLSLVQVFASPQYDPEALLRGVHQVIGPESLLIGASTIGEILNGVHQRAVVVVALASPYLQVKVAVGRGVSQDWEGAVIEAVTAPEIAPYFSAPEIAIWSLLSEQGESAFSLLFSPGAGRTADSGGSQVLETLQRLSQGRLPILGGDAVDTGRREGNFVLAGDEVYRNSILVAVFETSLTFGISRAPCFQPISRRATETLAPGLEVLEWDGQAKAAGGEALRQALLRGSIKDPGLAMVFSSELNMRSLGSRLGEEISGMRTLAPHVPMLGLYNCAPEGSAGDGGNGHPDEVIAVLALGRDLTRTAQLAMENESLRAALGRRDMLIAIDERPAPAGIDQAQSQNQLRKSESLFDFFMRQQPCLAVILDRDGRYLYVNESWEKFTGKSREEVSGHTVWDVWPPPVAALFQVKLLKALSNEPFQEEIIELPRGDETHFFLNRYFSIPDQDGKPGLLGGISIDITERQQIIGNLEETSEKLRALVQASPLAIYVLDPEGKVQTWNPAAERLFGWSEAEALGGPLPARHPDQPDQVRDACLRVMHGEFFSGVEVLLGRKDGAALSIRIFTAPLRGPHGQITGIMVLNDDITERKQAEDIFKSLIYMAPIGIFIAQDGKFTLVNPGVTKVTGYEEDDLLGQDSLIYVPEESREEVRTQVSQMLNGERTTPCEFRVMNKSGEITWVLETVTPIQYRGQRATLGFFVDINERVMLEGQLLQSQKLESVGRLAGGVAHDFNNMLTAIMGYSELVMMSSRENDSTSLHLEGIRKSAERAAALTRQLLAFSRKQMLQPRVTDLNTVITNLEAMLRRLIGEDINLVILLDQALKLVKTDPGQLEQVIMNLVINARDAMPTGGEITVQTANVYLNENFTRRYPDLQPGPYVQVAVIDHGLGMDQETLTHIFEPFFTTKEPGKGTGLGLSTAYGIIKQSGGHIEVASRPAGGTVFEIYLPQIEDTLEDAAEHCAFKGTFRGSETVLVVEDEELLLSLIQEALEMHGYHVLKAGNPLEALELVKGHNAPIDLLLTDVVMPHQNGRELAELLSPLHPEMKILFMSGYTEDAMVVRGLLKEALPFIQKPFPPMDLVGKVREVMESPRA